MITRIRRSLGLQIASFFSLLIVLIVALGVTGSVVQQQNTGEHAVKQQAYAIAQVAATGNVGAALFHSRDDARETVRGLEGLSTFEFIVIRSFADNPLAILGTDTESDTLYARGFQRAPTTVRLGRRAEFSGFSADTYIEDGVAVAIVPIVSTDAAGGVIGEVAVGLSTAEMEANIGQSIRLLVIIGLLGSLIFSAITFFFVRRLARPLIDLRDASLRVGEGDLRTADTDYELNEIGDLARSFNLMVDRLRVARETQAMLLRRSESLLLNILPASIAERLKQGETTIADHIDDCTVLFADIVGFTEMSSHKTPEELVVLLNKLFSEFDRLADKHGLEKIKMIGDAYMVAGGIPLPQDDHAQRVARFALEMVTRVREAGLGVDVRVGFHSGPVVAGVIGTRKFIYDLWGDTVNTSSRMESSGEPGRIQMTEVAYEKVKDEFFCTERGIIKVKGKGKLHTYFLDAERDPAAAGP